MWARTAIMIAARSAGSGPAGLVAAGRAFSALLASAFGRSNLTVSYASEAGHVLGKESAGNHPCHDCRQHFLKLVSPDGKRVLHACERYRVAEQRCADWSAR